MSKETLRQYKTLRAELAYIDLMLVQLQTQQGAERDIIERQLQRARILSIMRDIEAFIDSVSDPVDKCIFTMSVYDSMSYREIGDTLHMDYTRVGRRMDRYLDC